MPGTIEPIHNGILKGPLDLAHFDFQNDDGVTVFLRAGGSYSNPSWITTLAWGKLTGVPSTIAGYGITDFNSLGDARWSPLAHTHTFASLTSKPTTLSGYGINDAYTKTETDSAISSAVVGLLDDRGNYNASGNVFPSSGGSGAAGAILKGDLWTISVAGTLNGIAVTAGDVLRALIDTPGQTGSNWVVTENNLGYVPVNAAGTLSLAGFSAITGTLPAANVAVLNQNTTGSAASLSVSGQTGLLTFLGLTNTNRAKTVRDTADTILELGGSYAPTGTWTNLTLITPVLGTPASGVVTNLTGTASININGTVGATTPNTGAFTSETFTLSLKSTTALATPSALSATQFTSFASTISGACIMGYGTTNDVSLMNRAGTVVLGVGPNTTLVNIPGTLSVTGHTTFEGVTSTGATGTGKLVYDGTPTLVTPVIGVATGTSLDLTGTVTGNGLGVTKNQNGSTEATVTNSTAGALAGADFRAVNDTGNSIQMAIYSSTTTPYGALSAQDGSIYCNRSITFMSDLAGGVLKFAAGGNTEKMRVDTSRVTMSVPAKLKGYTVAGLPSGSEGDIAYATDLLTPAFLTTAVGGGSTKGPVFYNGAAWVAI